MGGMLNQVQYHAAFVENKDKLDSDEIVSGFQDANDDVQPICVAKHQTFRKVEPEQPNDTNIERTLDLISSNSPSLTDVNINNIKQVSIEQLRRFAKGLENNTHVTIFQMSNTNANDGVAKCFAEMLKKNKTLKELNMESNYITGDFIIELVAALGEHQTLHTMRLSNQRPEKLGMPTEMKIAGLVQYNYALLKLGLFLDTPAARIRVAEALQRNNDAVRRQRMGLPPLPKEAPPPEKKKAPRVAPSEVEIKSEEESATGEEEE